MTSTSKPKNPKKPEIVHLLVSNPGGRLVYKCNWACGITDGKFTTLRNKVSCKNCKKSELEARK